VAKWEEDFKHKEKLMKNMCEYPFIFDDRNLQSAGGLIDYNSDAASRGL
jgi:hypothetical protein